MILSIIALNYNGKTISIREEDDFVNLTEMAKAHRVRLDKWRELVATKKYLETDYKLNDGGAIKNRDLIQTEGGRKGGTWAATHIAINFARWISPEFATWCDQQIAAVLTKGYVYSPIVTEQQLENAIVEALPQIHDVDRLNRIKNILNHRILNVLEGVEVKGLNRAEVLALKEKIQVQWKIFEDDFLAMEKQKEAEWKDESIYPFIYPEGTDRAIIKANGKKLSMDKWDFWNNEKYKYDWELEAYNKIIYRLDGLLMGENRDTAYVMNYATNPDYPDFSERWITSNE